MTMAKTRAVAATMTMMMGKARAVAATMTMTEKTRAVAVTMTMAKTNTKAVAVAMTIKQRSSVSVSRVGFEQVWFRKQQRDILSSLEILEPRNIHFKFVHIFSKLHRHHNIYSLCP